MFPLFFIHLVFKLFASSECDVMRVCVREGSKRNTLHQVFGFCYLMHLQGSHTLVVASDGVWDVVSAEAVAAIVKRGEKGATRPHGLEGGPVLSTAYRPVC